MTELPGSVRTLLRLEGLAVLLACLAAYGQWADRGWGFFVVVFLLPDLSMLGYLSNPQVGAAGYNAAHCYVGPVLLGAASVLWLGQSGLGIALIWGAHIGLDRMLGYGLKFSSSFHSTHLGAMGRARRPGG